MTGFEELGKKLDKLTEEVKTVAQGGKGFGEINKLRLQIRRMEKDINDLLEQTGIKTYELHLQKKIGNIQLKSLGAKITRLKKEMETKKKRIQNLKKRG